MSSASCASARGNGEQAAAVEEEGIEKFKVSFDRLLGVIAGKRSTLAMASPPRVDAT
jgi:hypothetical protein